MADTNLPEVWLRGTLTGMPALLQPVAHALLQAYEELNFLMTGFPDYKLWINPAGVASPGFHLQHLTGVLDRLFTYAAGKQLNQDQLTYLTEEGKPAKKRYTTASLINAFNLQIDEALVQLSDTDESTLTNYRAVGRIQLPSTVMGLYVHAAEHTMRHLGQLLVTVNVLNVNIQINNF